MSRKVDIHEAKTHFSMLLRNRSEKGMKLLSPMPGNL